MDLSQCEVQDTQDIDEIIDQAIKSKSIAKQVPNIIVHVSHLFNIESNKIIRNVQKGGTSVKLLVMHLCVRCASICKSDVLRGLETCGHGLRY